MINNGTFMAMQSIYCYPFPETYAVMMEVQKKIDREMFKVTGDPKVVNKKLEGLFYEELKFPTTKMTFGEHDLVVGEETREVVNPDGLSKLLMKKIRDKYSEIIYSLNGFNLDYPFAYTTMGSSPALFNILAQLKTDGYKNINVLKGDYQGYKAYAESLKLEVAEYERLPAYEDKKSGVWFMSNPSAIDGNIIRQDWLNEMCARGNEFVFDLSYAGMTKPNVYFLHKNVKAVVFSMSKPYGLFRFRMGGFVFSREEIPSLFGNKWFNDTTRMLQAWKILEKFGFHKLYQKYRPIQEALVERVGEVFMFDMKPSDVFLMAYHVNEYSFQQEVTKMMKFFNRVGRTYRFCLTPYFEEMEKYKPKFSTLQYIDSL